MGKKGKKTRWRRLPIGGTDEESGLSLEAPAPASDPHRHRVTFNEDEYTKITTPRQDVLFKKGYLGRKRTPANPSPSETQEVHSGDSVENESYMSEEPQYAYPAPAGYLDPSGVYYVNGNTFEAYDPYTGTVTVVVGPPAQYPGAPPVLAALPCQPVPLQPVEWFNPAAAPWCYSYNRRKRYSTDSQNCSAQSSESTGPPGSPQESVDEAAAAMYPPPPGPQYVYPGYMFGPPIYNMNGMTVQGLMPQPVPMPPDLTSSKRRKKRRRKRRGGMTDDGSESSCCEEPLTCDVTGCQSETSQSGASSDAGVGPNSDSGINTNSGSNSPPLEHADQHQHHLYTSLCGGAQTGAREAEGEVEVSEELSTAEDDVTPNLCVAAPEFSSQESTLSCLSTPSAARDLLPGEHDPSSEVAQEEIETSHPVSCQQEVAVKEETVIVEVSSCLGNGDEILPEIAEPPPVNQNGFTTEQAEEDIKEVQEVMFELESLPLKVAVNETDEWEESELTEIEPVFSRPEEPMKVIINSIHEDESDSLSEELPDEHEFAQHINRQSLETSPARGNYGNGVELPEELTPKEENAKEFVVSFIFEQEKAKTVNDKLNEWEETTASIEVAAEFEINGEVTENLCIMNTTSTLGTTNASCDLLPRLSFTSDTLAPVPPPRRKKSFIRAVERIATSVVEEAMKEGLEEAARVRLKSPLSITEAVTRWLNSHESSPLTCMASDEETDDDEGIEVEEELTGQKNVQGNPFPASSHSDAGQRVANDCESAGEWDLWEMCDPARSVDKYYRLGADEGVPSIYKTAMHIRHTGPFPCGVCCIIQ